MATELTAYRLERDERPTVAEAAYIALFGGELWEVVGYAGPDQRLDTAYGNSEADALTRARTAGLRAS